MTPTWDWGRYRLRSTSTVSKSLDSWSFIQMLDNDAASARYVHVRTVSELRDAKLPLCSIRASKRMYLWCSIDWLKMIRGETWERKTTWTSCAGRNWARGQNDMRVDPVQLLCPSVALSDPTQSLFQDSPNNGSPFDVTFACFLQRPGRARLTPLPSVGIPHPARLSFFILHRWPPDLCLLK